MNSCNFLEPRVTILHMKLLMHLLFVVSFSVLVLFGVLPAAMAWSERYTDTCLPPAVKPVVPGGRFTLAVVMGAAGLVITYEALNSLYP